MEKKYVLAIDQSTQGTKAILFHVAGNLVCADADGLAHVLERILRHKVILALAEQQTD